MNQYSEDFIEYRNRYGTDPFIEYKNSSTTDERKQEIEDWVFHTLRKKNTVPQVKLNRSQEERVMVQLSNVQKESVYRDGEYWFNNIGVKFLSQFFPEINQVKKGEGNSHPSVEDFFHNDYRLKRCIKKLLTYSTSEMRLIEWITMAGAGYCSNFRPASAKSLYEVYGKEKGCRVLDSSAGFGARLLGAHVANNVTEYVGIDPNTANSCDKLIQYLKNNYPTDTKETVLKMGSEDFTRENYPEYQNYFDLYFTSPPYFNTERYSDDDTQSYKKFPTYAGWVKGFYRSTIYNACGALKDDGIFALNIFEKVPNIREITKMFLADCGWYMFKIDKYLLKTMPGSNHKFNDDGTPVIRDMTIGKNFEPVYMAKHYTRLLKEGLITQEQAEKCKKRISVHK